MLALNAIKLVYKTASLKVRKVNSNHTVDYDAAADTYDDFYSQHLSNAATPLSERMPLTSGMTVIDLASGTGFFTHRIARDLRGEGPRIASVDLSPGMLARNREVARQAGLDNIEFVEADALGYLARLPDGSVDAVVCGWGICYFDHDRFRDEALRVLRPGGFLAIIENTQRSLGEVEGLFRSVLLRVPNALVKNMDLDLPKDSAYLVRKFCRGGLSAREAWDGEVKVPVGSGAELVEYMIKSGASAGFLDALDPAHRDTVFTTLSEVADARRAAGNPVPVVHRYSALIAERA